MWGAAHSLYRQGNMGEETGQETRENGDDRRQRDVWMILAAVHAGMGMAI